MKSKINHWRNIVISLQGQVLVIKSLIFSCCTHILNTTYIASKHIDQMQHMLNEFLWWGKNKIPQQIFCQDFTVGGLRMLRVRDLVLELRIKWFRQLWNDKGASWSTFVWPQVLTALPSALMPGMSFVSNAWIQNIDAFYQDAIQSYVILNCLARAVPLDNPLPQNVWACHENKTINYPLVRAGIIEVLDLPLQNGSVDHCSTETICSTGFQTISLPIICVFTTKI